MAVSSPSTPKRRLKPNVGRSGRICRCKPSAGSPPRLGIHCGESSRPASMIAFRIHLSPGSGYSETMHLARMTSQTRSPRMTTLLPHTRNCTRGARNRVSTVSRSPSRKPITTCKITSDSSLRLVLVDASRYYRPDSPFGPRPEISSILFPCAHPQKPLRCVCIAQYSPPAAPYSMLPEPPASPPLLPDISVPELLVYSQCRTVLRAGTFT